MHDPILSPGQAAAMRPPLVEVVHSAAGISGLLVDSRGRLAIVLNGAGMRASFEDPGQLHALGMLLLGVAGQLADANASAAATAGAELAAIVKASGNPPEDHKP